MNGQCLVLIEPFIDIFKVFPKFLSALVGKAEQKSAHFELSKCLVPRIKFSTFVRVRLLPPLELKVDIFGAVG